MILDWATGLVVVSVAKSEDTKEQLVNIGRKDFRDAELGVPVVPPRGRGAPRDLGMRILTLGEVQNEI